MYLTSFIHRNELFDIAGRWFCGRLRPSDGLRLTQILISDGFVLGETMGALARSLMGRIYREPVQERRIHSKGELREALCLGSGVISDRERDLFSLYRTNPDFYYRETPIDGVMCLDAEDRLKGLYRIKRPRRIAEKANRKIANWIFHTVQARALEMAAERAMKYGIALELLFTPELEMAREFIEAEKAISRGLGAGGIEFDREALTIHDVGGIKIVADGWQLAEIESAIHDAPGIAVVEEESFSGPFRARSFVLECSWDPEQTFRKYRECRCWQYYLNRGIPQEDLMKGLDWLFQDPRPTIIVELLLSTFPDLVESELGESIHEERIIAQRDSKVYQGYIPMNVEFLIEYLFAVGFSPQTHIDQIPIKLWGRYLPDTLMSYMRQLYGLPAQDLLY